MGSSFFLSELSSWSYHSHYHYPLKLLQIVVLSSHQHQGTEPPSLAQQSGLSTQSCQKTSTNDTKVREKHCDASQKDFENANIHHRSGPREGGFILCSQTLSSTEQRFCFLHICIPAAILIYIANQGRRVRRLRRLHVRRRLLTQLGSRQRHPWHSRPGEGSSPSS